MIALRDELVARFAGLPGVVLAVAHDEDVDEDEIHRIGHAKTPAVLVVHLGADSPEVLPGEGVMAKHRWAAIVLATRGDAQELARDSRGDAAQIIGLRIAYELAAGDRFAAEHDRPEKVRVHNASNVKTARLGVAVAVVEWVHEGPIDPDDLVLELQALEIVTGTITPDEGPETVATAGSVGVEEEQGGVAVQGEAGDPVAAEGI